MKIFIKRISLFLFLFILLIVGIFYINNGTLRIDSERFKDNNYFKKVEYFSDFIDKDDSINLILSSSTIEDSIIPDSLGTKWFSFTNVSQNIYESYKNLGIKLYVGQSKTDELLCLSDLCITEPQTSVNYMILASNTPAIFLNMHHRTDIDRLAPFFGIKHIVKKEDDFVNLLRQFKGGELPKQYDNSDIELKSVDNAVELIDR